MEIKAIDLYNKIDKVVSAVKDSKASVEALESSTIKTTADSKEAIVGALKELSGSLKEISDKLNILIDERRTS